MGRSKCPHCGEKVVVRHTLIKSNWDDGRGRNPNSTKPKFNHQEMYIAFLDGVPKTQLMNRYQVSKRQIDNVIKAMREKRDLPIGDRNEV